MIHIPFKDIKNKPFSLPLYTTWITGQGVCSWLAIGQCFPDGHLETKWRQNRKSESGRRVGGVSGKANSFLWIFFPSVSAEVTTHTEHKDSQLASF